jgi:hypothetical protein
VSVTGNEKSKKNYSDANMSSINPIWTFEVSNPSYVVDNYVRYALATRHTKRHRALLSQTGDWNVYNQRYITYRRSAREVLKFQICLVLITQIKFQPNKSEVFQI